jgi:hypothetical protein
VPAIDSDFAYVWRVEEINRKRVVVKFSTWGAVAFAGIRELPETLQDRSIVIRLVRAKPGEVKAHLKNGTSPTLQLIKAKLARWALDLREFPEPTLPSGLHNRLGDNWAPLFAIAEIAGGRWPALIKRAALSAISADQGDGQLVALLDGIRRAFGEKNRTSTRELIDALLADDEHDWAAANKGRPINEAWLRERLRGVITCRDDGKPGSERWGPRTKEVRGYSRRRFEDPWARYLFSRFDTENHPADPATNDNHPQDQDKPSPDEGASTRRREGEHPATDSGEEESPDGDALPDAEGPAGGCNKAHTATDNQLKSDSSSASPDTPGDLAGIGEKTKSNDVDLMDEMPDVQRRSPPGKDASPPKWEPL